MDFLEHFIHAPHHRLVPEAQHQIALPLDERVACGVARRRIVAANKAAAPAGTSLLGFIATMAAFPARLLRGELWRLQTGLSCDLKHAAEPQFFSRS
jgi:hypothetical protein